MDKAISSTRVVDNPQTNPWSPEHVPAFDRWCGITAVEAQRCGTAVPSMESEEEVVEALGFDPSYHPHVTLESVTRDYRNSRDHGGLPDDSLDDDTEYGGLLN